MLISASVHSFISVFVIHGKEVLKHSLTYWAVVKVSLGKQKPTCQYDVFGIMICLADAELSYVAGFGLLRCHKTTYGLCSDSQ